VCVELGRIARGGLYEVLDVRNGVDATACAYGGAVESGGGAGEIKLTLKRPFLEQAIDEAGVEDVTGSGGVGYRDAVSGSVVESLTVPRENAVMSECCSGEG
jgi:hypothetical protein